MKVVATTTQICDYVTQIATDESDDAELSFNKTGSDGNTTHFGADPDTAKSELDLTCILAPNASAHDHEMTPQQMAAMTEANLLMVNGVDLEHFLDRAVEASGFSGTLVVTSGFLTSDEKSDEQAVLEAEKSLPYKVYRGEEQVDINEWPFATAAGEEPEFIYDPHVWTSPHNAMVQVTNIGAALEDIRAIRNRGYAIDDEEHVTGLRCLAAVVWSPQGEAACAISVSGLAARLSDTRIAAQAAHVTTIAAQLTAALGGRQAD